MNMEAPRENLIRTADFEVTRSEDRDDGLTLEGYAAVFDSPTEINSYEGHFLERIKPGAFGKTLSERMPVLMFNHGKHPLIGDMPIGIIQHAREDARGVFVRARLATNWLVDPVREAISQGAITGMSFRFSVPEGKEVWRRAITRGGVRERDILEVSCRELGPVVFPAYDATTCGVRSREIIEALDDLDLRREIAYALLDERADMNYADPGYQSDGQKRYPLDSAAHVRAAWSYINMPRNAAMYNAQQLKQIKARIKAAAKTYGVEISEEQSNSEDFDLQELATLDEAAREDTSEEVGSEEAEPAEATPGRSDKLSREIAAFYALEAFRYDPART